MPDVSSDTAAALSWGATEPGIGRISLPKPLTSFIGRERELAQAKRLLADSYLVTLTGPGGSGKTRLCIALAAAVAGDYPDGVYFVPLAPGPGSGAGAVDDRPEHRAAGRQGPVLDGAPGQPVVRAAAPAGPG